MPHATIVVTIDDPLEFFAVEDWFSRWGPKLTHRSDNYGCGCCVDIWEVDAPGDAILELPPKTYAGDEWTNGRMEAETMTADLAARLRFNWSPKSDACGAPWLQR